MRCLLLVVGGIRFGFDGFVMLAGSLPSAWSNMTSLGIVYIWNSTLTGVGQSAMAKCDAASILKQTAHSHAGSINVLFVLP